MSIEKLVGAIKAAGTGAVDARGPVAVLFGTVTGISPLALLVDQRLPLTSEFLVVTEGVEPLQVTIAGADYPIRRGLEAGDTVVLLRVQGGQQYLVLGRVADA